MTGSSRLPANPHPDRIAALASSRDRALTAVRWLTGAGGALAVLATTGTAVAIAASTPAHHATVQQAEAGPAVTADDAPAAAATAAPAAVPGHARTARAKRKGITSSTRRSTRASQPVAVRPAPVQVKPAAPRPVPVQPAPRPAPVTTSGS